MKFQGILPKTLKGMVFMVAVRGAPSGAPDALDRSTNLRTAATLRLVAKRVGSMFIPELHHE